MTSTKQDNDTSLLTDFDVTPSCQYGHPGELDYPGTTPCNQPAEYYSNYHVCPQGPPVTGAGCILWCSTCLANKTLFVKRQLDSAGGLTLRCRYCKQPMPELKDWIWGTTPIG